MVLHDLHKYSVSRVEGVPRKIKHNVNFICSALCYDNYVDGKVSVTFPEKLSG